jgi:hypothetical protein
MKLKLKLDDKGNVVLSPDGKPIYVAEDGKEIVFDAEQARTDLAAARLEARNNRVKAEETEAKLAAFGELDPQKAKDALAAVANLSTKDAEREAAFQTRLNEAAKEHQKQLAAKDAEFGKLSSDFDSSVIGGAFARSKFLAEKGASGMVDFIQAYYVKNFERSKDGKIVAKDNSGNLILSTIDPGNPAGFEEALEKLISGHPQKDALLKPTNPGGGGTQPGAGGGAGGKRVVTRRELDAMDPAAQAKAATEFQIVD